MVLPILFSRNNEPKTRQHETRDEFAYVAWKFESGWNRSMYACAIRPVKSA